MYAWHVHHTVLYETLTTGGLSERQWFISTHKPIRERARRLRLLRLVKNQELLRLLNDATVAGVSKPPSVTLRRRIRTAIEALHREECPRCPWNGRTIFPKKYKRKA